MDPERVFGDHVRASTYRVRMRVIGRIVQFLVGLAVLIALVGLAGWVVYSSITQAPAVVAAVITGFAALIGLARSSVTSSSSART